MSDDIKVELYCDGGFSHKYKTATWAFVTVLVVNTVRSPLAGYFGSVVVSPEHPEWVGAEKQSNQTAELSAMNWALRWLSARKEKVKHATVISDSVYAIRMTDSTWKRDLDDATVNIKLIENNRDVYERVLVDLCWVKGHSGNEWNHLADYLAQKAKKQHGPDAKRKCIGKKKLNAWIPQALLN